MNKEGRHFDIRTGVLTGLYPWRPATNTKVLVGSHIIPPLVGSPKQGAPPCGRLCDGAALPADKRGGLSSDTYGRVALLGTRWGE